MGEQREGCPDAPPGEGGLGPEDGVDLKDVPGQQKRVEAPGGDDRRHRHCPYPASGRAPAPGPYARKALGEDRDRIAANHRAIIGRGARPARDRLPLRARLRSRGQAGWARLIRRSPARFRPVNLAVEQGVIATCDSALPAIPV